MQKAGNACLVVNLMPSQDILFHWSILSLQNRGLKPSYLDHKYEVPKDIFFSKFDTTTADTYKIYQYLPAKLFFWCCLTLKMKLIHAFETSGTVYESTWRNVSRLEPSAILQSELQMPHLSTHGVTSLKTWTFRWRSFFKVFEAKMRLEPRLRLAAFTKDVFCVMNVSRLTKEMTVTKWLFCHTALPSTTAHLTLLMLLALFYSGKRSSLSQFREFFRSLWQYLCK
jgi:hypothetical protein